MISMQNLWALALRSCRSGCRVGGYLTSVCVRSRTGRPSGCRGTLRVPRPTS